MIHEMTLFKIVPVLWKTSITEKRFDNKFYHTSFQKSETWAKGMRAIIGQKAVMCNDKKYVCWKVCINTEWEMGIGKQIQWSFTGELQTEIRKKMKTAIEANG